MNSCCNIEIYYDSLTLIIKYNLCIFLCLLFLFLNMLLKMFFFWNVWSFKFCFSFASCETKLYFCTCLNIFIQDPNISVKGLFSHHWAMQHFILNCIQLVSRKKSLKKSDGYHFSVYVIVLVEGLFDMNDRKLRNIYTLFIQAALYSYRQLCQDQHTCNLTVLLGQMVNSGSLMWEHVFGFTQKGKRKATKMFLPAI